MNEIPEYMQEHQVPWAATVFDIDMYKEENCMLVVF